MKLVTSCHDTAVEGIKYLFADLSLPCYDHAHVVSLVSSICVLGLLGMGLPAFIFFKTRKQVGAESKFHFFCGKFFLLISSELTCDTSVGYNLESCAWWEAAILCRKLLLQCVVVLVSDLFVQGVFFLFCKF
jgi:hypothetical protein